VNKYEPRSLMLVCTEEAYCAQQVTRSDRTKQALCCITSIALSPNSYVAADILAVPSQHQHLQSQERLFDRPIHQSLSHHEPPTPQLMWCWPGSDASPIQDQSSIQHGAYHSTYSSSLLHPRPPSASSNTHSSVRCSASSSTSNLQSTPRP
jgi:hypothetical protein